MAIHAQRSSKKDSGSCSKEDIQDSCAPTPSRGKRWEDLEEVEEDQQEVPKASRRSGNSIVPETQDTASKVQSHTLDPNKIYWDDMSEI